MATVAVLISTKRCKTYKNTGEVQNLSLLSHFSKAIQWVRVFAGSILAPGLVFNTPALTSSGARETEAFPNCHRERGRVHPGQVAVLTLKSHDLPIPDWRR